jgi:hypothetical protein
MFKYFLNKLHATKYDIYFKAFKADEYTFFPVMKNEINSKYEELRGK